MQFQKPPMGATIDWSHPLAQGLAACFLFNEKILRPNKLNNLANPEKSLTVEWYGTSNDSYVTPDGVAFRGVQFNNSFSYSANDGVIIDDGSIYTLLTVFKTPATTAGLILLGGSGRVNYTTYGRCLRLEDGIFYAIGSEGSTSYRITTAVQPNTLYVAIGVFGTNGKLWMNGSLVGTASMHQKGYDYAYVIGINSSGVATLNHIEVIANYCWNRPLSNGEAISLSQDPYQFLRTAEKPRFITAGRYIDPTKNAFKWY